MSKWPQPHEGVTGIKRTRDDLLALDEAAMQRRVVILQIATELWRAALNGAHTESGRELYERMANPRMGDLVVETVGMRTPLGRDSDGDARAVTCFGILLGQRTEWSCTDEKWREYQAEAEAEGYTLADADRITDEGTYVQYGPEPQDICRWANCSLIALPTGMLYHTADQNP